MMMNRGEPRPARSLRSTGSTVTMSRFRCIRKNIVLPVFDYGSKHALTNGSGTDILRFPNPMIVYLYEDGDAPDYQHPTIDFGEQGTFDYQIPTFKYLKMSSEYLNRRKLIILIPFQLLRLRKSIEQSRSPENLEALKVLIKRDIIDTINENIAAGNVTVSDGRKLKRLALQLYRHIYSIYEEIESAGVNTMVEKALILDIDIIEMEHKKELREKDSIISEKDAIISEKDAAIFEKDTTIKNMIIKWRSMGVLEAEISEVTGMTLEQLKSI